MFDIQQNNKQECGNLEIQGDLNIICRQVQRVIEILSLSKRSSPIC